VLYATRAIRQGEEICDCYIELRQNKTERRKELNRWYRFTCTCVACGGHGNESSDDGIIKSCEEADECGTQSDNTESDSTKKTTKESTDLPDHSRQEAPITDQNKKQETVDTVFSKVTKDSSHSGIVSKDKVKSHASLSDDDRRVMAMDLDKRMMQLAEEGRVQLALNCALQIVEVNGGVVEPLIYNSIVT
jgi:hypothetical protein